MFTGKNPASRTSGWPPVPRVLQAIIFIALLCSVAAAQTYNATFLVSDIPAAATHTDKKLVNPLGTGLHSREPVVGLRQRIGILHSLRRSRQSAEFDCQNSLRQRHGNRHSHWSGLQRNA